MQYYNYKREIENNKNWNNKLDNFGENNEDEEDEEDIYNTPAIKRKIG